MDKASIKEELGKWRRHFHTGQRLWSLAYHGAMYSSIFSSVGATLLLQFGYEKWATGCTSLAAALTALAAGGGFERKWRSNRLSRCRVDMLLLDVEEDSPDFCKIKDEIKEILFKHDAEIVKTEKKVGK